jgi:VPDSG-CTERM motif
MVKKITIIAMTMVFLASFSSTASASLIDTVGVVGVIKGKLDNASPETEKLAAQHLLEMYFGSTDANGYAEGANPCNIIGDAGCYATGPTEYTANIAGDGVRYNNDYTVDAGYEFALAKYDGQNGGYVLFYIGGNATALPAFSAPFWGTGTQYDLAHHTVFNATDVTGEPTPFGAVPDGGSTLLMLGAALGGFGFVRGRFKA